MWSTRGRAKVPDLKTASGVTAKYYERLNSTVRIQPPQRRWLRSFLRSFREDSLVKGIKVSLEHYGGSH